ncbi:putative calcium-dependent phosphotriesterase protein [Botrytis fragariae]|uniref:Putative calcium-dependent phosphotriesterase protein n=1 Tax=Botrytis fragariae TaxID=1964551 RepID=A0A8H6EET8_9HELO|nr:putative calcium-dependent phosphotriesterase protein [Botrytis fragariae]KAF5869310.1 putative calcium-dependent phosphotriesterase protein [Botrytis fragariae]
MANYISVIVCVYKLLVVAQAALNITLNTTIFIDPVSTYLIPPNYHGNISQTFIDTQTSNTNLSVLLTSAKSSPFISYDPEFLKLLGANPTATLIAQRNYSFANEAGIWYPIINPNGGTYFDHLVYFAGDGNATISPAIYAIDPATGYAEIIINSYFGVPFNGPNDLTWVNHHGTPYLFFTDDPLSSLYDGGPSAVLPDAVWRFSPTTKSLIPVISRADILVPNGINVNAAMNTLYVTDTTPITTTDSGGYNSGSNAIYKFDLDTDMFPVNKRLIGISRTGIPDGIHIDDKNRIWTAEGEGIVVRNNVGKVLGLFNAEVFLHDPAGEPGIEIANFALAGDVLVVEGSGKLWTVKLAEVVVSPDRYVL